MAKKLGFLVLLLACLLVVDFLHVQVESQSPALSPERETPADTPLPSDSSPEADSLPPPASSPEAEPLPDSPPPPPPPSQTESPSSSSLSPGPAPVDAPSDNDSGDEPETEYFPSPTPSPAASDVGKPDDMKASKDEDEFEKARDEYNGMSALQKAGIAVGAILGVGAIVIGALVYKKRRDNLIRARYTYFSQGEFL
ncbi:unnamed protein product [Cochlearia groenlandica]